MSNQQHHNELPAGYTLHWYQIESVLGQGGFGITYISRDTNLNQRVAIKEFLPFELAARGRDGAVHPLSADRADSYAWGLSRFLTEAQTLARFRHPNIVRVLSVFEANSTAYMVMEYEHGRSLKQIYVDHGPLGEGALLNVVLPLLDGLSQVHEAGFIHRDIKPDNIYLRHGGTPVLLDFGSARQALGAQTRTLTSLVSPGYAPFEQYDSTSESDKQGPWTDIYALGATLYRGLFGEGPVDALSRANALLQKGKDPYQPAAKRGKDHHSRAFLDSVDRALAFNAPARPQTVGEWRALFPVPSSEDGDATVRRPMVPPPSRRGRQAAAYIGAAVAVMAVVAGGLWFILRPPAVPSRALVEVPPAVVRPAPTTPEQPELSAPPPVPAPSDPLSVDLEVGPRLSEDTRITAAEPLGVVGPPEPPVPVIPTMPEPPAPPESGETMVERAPAVPAPVMQPVEVATLEPLTAEKTESQVEETIARLLALAEADLAAFRLTTPAGNNALSRYREILALDAENPDARLGTERIVARYIELAERMAASQRYDKAEDFLRKAADLAPGSENVARARERFRNRQVEAQQAPVVARPTTVSPLPEIRATTPVPVSVPEPPAPRSESAVVASSQPTVQTPSPVPAGPVRMAVLPFFTSKNCFQPVDDRLRDIATGIIERNPSFALVPAPAVNRDEIWAGNAVRKEPNLPAVYRVGEQAGAQAVFMAFIKCSDNERVLDDNFPFEAYVVDLGGQQTYRAEDTLLRMREGAREVFGIFRRARNL